MEKTLEQRVTDLENAFAEFFEASKGFYEGFTRQISLAHERISDHTEAHEEFVRAIKSIAENLEIIKTISPLVNTGSAGSEEDLQQKS